MTSFYSQEELLNLGFAEVGEAVHVSRNASIYGAENIRIGNHVRIDDFAVLSGKIDIGDYVHIAVGSLLFAGEAGIEVHDFSTLSSRGAIYAISDDYSGEYMTNPTIPEEYRGVSEGKVIIGKHAIIGTGSTILPSVTLGEGVSVGAMSLIKNDIEPWTIVAGVPAKFVKQRSRKLLELEKQLLEAVKKED